MRERNFRRAVSVPAEVAHRGEQGCGRNDDLCGRHCGCFPGGSRGRSWFVCWMMPYPNHRYLWPNFNSPLVWDIFAISTYATISVFFEHMGLVQGFATMRDGAINPLGRVMAPQA